MYYLLDWSEFYLAETALLFVSKTPLAMIFYFFSQFFNEFGLSKRDKKGAPSGYQVSFDALSCV